MKTITLRADEALINQILAISKALAEATNKKLESITDGAEYQSRFSEYEADIEAIERGELTTYSLKGIRDEVAKW